MYQALPDEDLVMNDNLVLTPDMVDTSGHDVPLATQPNTNLQWLTLVPVRLEAARQLANFGSLPRRSSKQQSRNSINDHPLR